MIAVDASILVYSVREDSPRHGAVLACLGSLAEGGATWAIPWPCIHEFLAVVTHDWEHLKSMLAVGKAVGPLVHDARVAIICRAWGVAQIWTADRDYSRFAGILYGPKTGSP